jgi:hypothetical protein
MLLDLPHQYQLGNSHQALLVALTNDDFRQMSLKILDGSSAESLLPE